MSYEVIEKNEYGVLVKNTTNQLDCTICKFEPIDLNICINYCGGGSNKYYLTDQEAAKLETKKQKPLADEIIGIQKDKINMLEDTLEKIISSQKELIDLQIENKKLKERIGVFEGLLRSEELKVAELKNKIPNEIKRFECGTDDLVVFKYLIENKIKVMRYDNEILTVINITELQSYPILMSNGEKYSKNGFFKNFTNINGTEFFYD